MVNTDSNRQIPFFPSHIPNENQTNKSKVFFKTKIIQSVSDKINKLYEVIKKIFFDISIFFKTREKNLLKIKAVPIKEPSDFSISLKNEIPYVNKLQKSSDIEKAEKNCQQKENAFNFIRRQKMGDAIAIVHLYTLSVENFVSKALNGESHKEELRAFTKEIKEIQDFLAKEKEILVPTLDKEMEKLTEQEVSDHIKNIFDLTRTFHQKVIALNSQLGKDFPDKKELVVSARAFSTQIGQQQAIHRIPSSEDYLNRLREEKIKAEEELEQLKKN